MSLRHLVNGLAGAAVVLALAVMLRTVALPDAGATLFQRAGQLEAAGQVALALQHYRLLAQTHPESTFASRALLRAGDLLAARGRSSNDPQALRDAVGLYQQLATQHSADPLASEALFNAGGLAFDDLRDFPLAARLYTAILKRSDANSDDAALATARLGRVARLGRGSIGAVRGASMSSTLRSRRSP